ncbi:MBL fold metallo-hydrolase [Chitinophaga barathri]|uniref:MBL fold metallo-hydrolase n=1 Tax=Chitinophaga barathri TaxID=1647451 RepID=A0A3N4MJX4_9BACT|nr:MBL fold metallo-hydrolase [Chitinophaga barathri]RPD42376.1 MBL fold metallo-hydrolase [Chitinophaga barathri]
MKVNIKMFQVGELGDCFLLKFIDGEKKSHVLIDCGSFRNSNKSKERLQKIVKHILDNELSGGLLDLVVATHQHNDHVSGFLHAADLFKDKVKQVWLPWLDDPRDPPANKLRLKQQNLLDKMGVIYQHLQQKNLQEGFPITKDILDFYGATDDGPAVPLEAMKILRKMGKKPVKYLEPGTVENIPRFTQKQLKAYVLGPPRNPAFLYDITANKDETYDHKLELAFSGAEKLAHALENKNGITGREEQQFPFNLHYKRSKEKIDSAFIGLYDDPRNDYRTIDSDWLNQVERLALYMDSYTNNSSLVLAFELVESQKVLLFVGDAQTGNWNSWKTLEWKGAHRDFNIRNMLQNTVLYKVGHHASHNASLKEAIEDMTHEDLVALIPVDRTDGNITKTNGWKMPAKNLYKKLKTAAKHRVLVMDVGFDDDCRPDNGTTGWSELSAAEPEYNEDDLYISITVED